VEVAGVALQQRERVRVRLEGGDAAVRPTQMRPARERADVCAEVENVQPTTEVRRVVFAGQDCADHLHQLGSHLRRRISELELDRRDRVKHIASHALQTTP
jgi:hypothetical protein